VRVLLSAYACQPGMGSEPGKGWLLAQALMRQGCEVTVLTCGSHHRAAIEAHLDACPSEPRPTFLWHDVPGWPGPGYDQPRHIRQHYMLWQMTARAPVRRLLRQRRFDVIHHLTWTVLRWPSHLGGLGPRFVFGPVGGGESAPVALRAGLSPVARRHEALRDLLNAIGRVDPLVRLCLRRADAILVTDAATRAHVPARHRGRAVVVTDILAPDMPVAEDGIGPPTAAAERGPLRLLFAGRLEAWKGAHLAIMALSVLRRSVRGARLTIAGTGPEAVALRQLTVRLGLPDEAVTFAGLVPHRQMAGLYACHDLFVFPSLHDSGPHVIGEALAAGLPVICLDLGGPGVAVNASCGSVVPTCDADPAQLAARIADAVVDVIRSPAHLAALGRGARDRAAMFTADMRARDLIARFYEPAALSTPGVVRPNRTLHV